MIHTFGWIDISRHRTAAALEYDFRHMFGLSVQVMHKSGNLWLDTTQTDYLTLGHLDEEGKLAEERIFLLP
jgi:hypothetical protein